MKYFYCFILTIVLNAEIIELKDILNSIELNHPLVKATNEEKIQAEAQLLSNYGEFDNKLIVESNNYPTTYYERSRIDASIEKPLMFQGSKLIAGYRQSNGNLPSYEDEFRTSSNGKFRAGFEIPLLRNGSIDRRRVNINKSEFQKKIADASIESRKNELFKVGTILYWNWVFSSEKVKIYEQLIAYAKKRQNQLIVKANSGDTAKFDVSDNKRQLLQRESQLLTAKQDLNIAIQDLSLFYRDQEGSPIIINDKFMPQKRTIEIPNNLLTHDLETIYNKLPEYRKYELELEQNKLENKLADNQLLPKFDTQLMMEQENSKIDQTEEPLDFKVGVKFEFPLERRAAKGKLAETESKNRELNQKITFFKQKIKNDLEIAKQNIQYAKEKYKIAKNEKNIAIELEKGEQERFNHGDSNLIFLNIREQTASEAASKLLDAEFEIQKTIAEIRYILLDWK